jgi:hypothetical protein
MGAENYYQILGINQDADDEDVKHAFREKAKHLHPDRNPDNPEAELRFKLLNTAYDALKDPARRESYNQYLSFNQGREKSERRQWGRLFGVLALLLLGPSAVFATVYSLGGLSLLFDETAQTPPLIEVAREQAQPKPLPAPEPRVVEPPVAAQPAPSTAPEPQPEPEERPAGPSDAEIALNTPPQPVLPPQPAPQLRPRPVPETEIPRSATPVPIPEPAPPEPRVEESRAAPPLPAAPPGQETGEDRGSSNAALDPFEGPDAEAERLEQAARPESESDARASARLLAELKEPDRAGGASEPPQVAAIPRQEQSNDTFVDCPTCPLMSTNTPPDLRDQAVSLSEITVAQWNACVRDGICAPYGRNAAPDTPIIGISRRNAAAYAEWLSARTGETYRIVMPSADDRDEPAQAAADCAPRGNLNGFEWLEDDRPRAPCPPTAANGEERPAGFRVARKLRRQS